MVEVLTHGQIMKRTGGTLNFYNAFKGVDYTKAAKINFLKQKAVLNENRNRK